MKQKHYFQCKTSVCIIRACVNSPSRVYTFQHGIVLVRRCICVRSREVCIWSLGRATVLFPRRPFAAELTVPNMRPSAASKRK